VTQPLTSKMIAAHPSTFQLYLQRALKDNWVTQEVRQPPPLAVHSFRPHRLHWLLNMGGQKVAQAIPCNESRKERSCSEYFEVLRS
jgi:hypothetical protein